MGSVTLKGLTQEELEAQAVSLGHPAFRGRQLFRWLYQENVSDFSQMTDLSKSFREQLAQQFSLPRIQTAEEQHSVDGTVKYLARLEDGQKVEAVFIPAEDRNTLCVSTQVGCKMGCTFCATAYQGWTRDLKSWEIVDQLFSLKFPSPISNIVLMGMGEPFDNYDEVIRALKIFQHPNGAQIGKRHITVSTVGLTPKIQTFLDANLGKLAISLHGTTEEQRGAIMPVSRKYPIENIVSVCRQLKMKARERITFEYLLIRDFNDSLEDAKRLARLLEGIPSKINLLAYNENPFTKFKRPSDETIVKFKELLLSRNLTATFRVSRGRDIAAACGQLRTATDLRRISPNRSYSLPLSVPR